MTASFRVLALIALALCALAQAPPHPADPYADPAHDPYNVLRYIPSNTLTGVSHGLVLAVAAAQLYLATRYRTWWMLILPISAIFFAEGLAVRFILASNPESLTAYISFSSLVVLSPCLFIATNYIILGRLASFLAAERHLLVVPSRITKIFVFSDVTTFLIQGAGGGLGAVQKEATAKLGGKLLTIGLALQLVSYAFFTVVFTVFIHRVRTREPQTWRASVMQSKPRTSDWRALAGALAVSCVGILVRSVYRVAQGSQGHFGTLATTEWIFFTFDTLPLFIAISVYVPFWPGRFLPAPKRDGGEDVGHELAHLERASAHGSAGNASARPSQ